VHGRSKTERESKRKRAKVLKKRKTSLEYHTEEDFFRVVEHWLAGFASRLPAADEERRRL
jgi:hypothetical protein